VAVSEESVAVSVSRIVPAPPDDVWSAVVTASRRARWWPGFEFEPRVGGAIDESWQDGDGSVHRTTGTIRRLDEPVALEFEWIDEGWRQPSVVRLLLAAEPGGTRVTVTESGLDDVTGEPGLADEHRQGWELHLSALAEHVGGRS